MIIAAWFSRANPYIFCGWAQKTRLGKSGICARLRATGRISRGIRETLEKVGYMLATFKRGIHLYFPTKKEQASLAAPWSSIPPGSSCSAYKPEAAGKAGMALEAAKALIDLTPKLSEQQWIKEMKRIWQLHPVEGPIGTLYVLKYVQKRNTSPMLEAQIQTCREAILEAAKLRHGYIQYGMTPWEVVHHKPKPQIPRFFSEPAYRTRPGFE